MDIKSKRMSLNMTQDALAQKLNIRRTTVSMWESGKSAPPAKLLPELAKILQCDISDLFDESA